MAEMFNRQAAPCQAHLDSPGVNDQGKSLSLVLSLLRESIDECKWKHGALAVQLGLPKKSGEAYLARMLSGEKPWTLRHLVALPDDIEKTFAEKWARARGAVVVAPLSGPAAIEGFVGGLIGLLTASSPGLPAKADAMLRAELPAARKRA